MKKTLLILLCFPLLTLAQQTYVPDDNFEAYLEANGMGDGIANNDSVTTSNIVGITSLDVSSQTISDLTGIEDFTALTNLDCSSNQLTCLNVQNGNNSNFVLFAAHYGNLNLSCVEVDDVAWSTTNWTMIDPQHYFSTNCPPSAIQEHSTNKELLKVTDLLGRETKQTNQPLLYIYDDGTVEKRMVIE